MHHLPTARLESLIEASKVLNSTLDLDRLLTLILDLTTRNLDAERGTIYLVDEERNELWSRVLKGDGMAEIRLPLGTGLAGTVARSGETINLTDVQTDPRFDKSFDLRSGFITRSMLCMPMKNNKGKIIGVFQVINDRTGAFDAADEMFLQAFSEQVSLAIENARLYQASLENERTARELQIASQIQQRLIPRTIPPVPGYEASGYAVPSKSIGGDFYDVIHLPSGVTVFCIADVSGKGIPAALLVSTLHASLRAYLESGFGLVDLVAKLNDVVYVNSPDEQYITFFILVLDTVSHRASYVNAGHCYPLVHRRKDGSFEELEASGLPLGMLEGMTYQLGDVVLQRGDVLVMYTDGITEAMDRNKNQFDLDRTKAAISRAAGRPAFEIQSALQADVAAFIAGEPPSDDATVVVLRRL